MARLEYRAFRCEGEDDLTSHLNEAAGEGWQLHTVNPVVVMGREGIGTLHYAAVMHRLVEDEDESSDDEEPGAMPMRG